MMIIDGWSCIANGESSEAMIDYVFVKHSRRQTVALMNDVGDNAWPCRR